MKKLTAVAQFLSDHIPIRKAALVATLAVIATIGLHSLSTASQVVDISDLRIARVGHTATLLENGRVLIAGGQNAGGEVTDSELFDPHTRTFSLAAGLTTGRTEHTATLLEDGRVFIVGGRAGNRLLDSTEIYDPVSNSFSRGPSLHQARAGHSATVIESGRLLIAGGEDSGSAEIFDSATQRFAPIPNPMRVARSYHGAALLKNGRVLLAGGLDGWGEMLRQAEIFDPETLEFAPAKNAMHIARLRPTLRVLPDGKVQAIGGDSERTMEMFNPTGEYFTAYAHLRPRAGMLATILGTESRAALIQREDLIDPGGADDMRGTLAELLDRSGYTLTEIPHAGIALAAGGLASDGVAQGTVILFSTSGATVTTDKTDYAPGETVIITGTGWLAGETVNMVLHREPETQPDTTLSSVADASGNFTNSTYVIDILDLDVTFTLTATGVTSGRTAQTTFTDHTPTPTSLVATAVSATQINLSWTGPTPGSGANANHDYHIERCAGSGCSSFVEIGTTSTGTTFSDTPLPSPGTYRYRVRYHHHPTTQPPTGFSAYSIVAEATTCTPPTISCPAASSASANASCQAAIPNVASSATVSGSCTPITVTQSPAAGTLVGLGTHTITVTATNTAGQSSSCTTTFTVNDTTAPVITLSGPNPVTLECGTAFSDPGATATDNCSAPFAATASGSVNVNAPGTYTITYTATDPSGNAATPVTRTVNVVDTTPPVITLNGANPITVECHTSFTDPGATANDSCFGSLPVTASGSVDVNTPGTYTITYHASDLSGNAATPVTRTVNVIDTTPPVITTGPANQSANANGNCQASVPDFTAGVVASDTCSAVTLSQSPAVGTLVGLGSHTITVTVTDAAGNFTTASATFTVSDATPPTITIGPSNKSANANGSCQASVPDFTVGVVASDNCSAVTFTQSPAAGTLVGLGSHTITVTATDAAGNSTTASATFTVKDTTAPVITTPPANQSANANGSCQASVPDFTVGVVASDNCSAVTFTQSPAAGTLVGLGPHTIIVKATDAAGNFTTASATFTVTDVTPPAIICPADINIVDNAPGQCGANVNPGTATATDNCSVPTIVGVRSDSQALNALYPLGTRTITWTATDAAGNSSNCTQTITVTNPAPVVSITGPPSGSVYAVGTAVNFTGSFTDNSGDTHTATWTFTSASLPTPATLSGSVNEGTGVVTGQFTFTGAGVYSVKLTVTDDCGNSVVATQVDGFDALVVIYDPSAGFVTGGGWINSPWGAIPATPEVVGKANFGFVSKYHKGATIPTGQTEFQFKAGSINFHSGTYDWLVIAGARAQYKGVGKINGTGNYGFMLTVIDGQLPGGGGVDKFRIKIWDKDNGDAIVYDNQLGAIDDVDPTTALGGGSVVIHKK